MQAQQGILPVQPFTHDDTVILASYQQRYEEQQTQGNLREASHFLNEMAFLFWNHNYFREAIKNYSESLRINEKIENESGQAMLHNNLGMLHADIKDYEQSLYHFQRTLAARKAFDEKIGIISAQVNLSVVLNNLGRHDEAAEGLQEALRLAREMNDPVQMRSCYGLLSETYEKAGDLRQSLEYFELYRTFHEMIQREEVAELQQVIKKEQFQKELVEKKAQINADELNQKQREIRKIEQEMVQYDSALSNLTDALSKKELQLQLVQQQAQIDSLRYQREQQETEIKLSHEQELRYRLFLILAFLAVLMILGIVVFLRIRKINNLLVQKNKQIEVQNRDLAENNELKDKLFSIIAHDLRTPLASFRDALDMISSGALDPEETKLFLSELTLQANNTSALVDDLLYWSRSQMKGIEAVRKNAALAPVVQEVVDTLSEQAAAKQLKVHVEVPASLRLPLDVGILKVVMRNILSNAIKFTPVGGDIYLEAGQNGNTVELRIRDTGIGMSDSIIDNLLNGNRANSRKGTNNETGTGLGLMFSRDLVKAHQAELTITSKPGKGSTFTIVLATK